MRSREEFTSRAMWPVTTLSIALGVAVAAALAARGTEGTRNSCHLAAYADRLDSTRLRIPYRPPDCTAADTQYHVWLWIGVISAAVTLAALAWFLRRAHEAAASGEPWPTRRITTAVCDWLNERLPGRPFDPGRLTAASLALLAIVLVAGGLVWRAYRSGQDATNLRSTASELAAVSKLPTGLTRPRAHCLGGALCALSSEPAPQAARAVARFLKSTVEPGLTEAHCASGACLILVGGVFHGFPTLAALEPAPVPGADSGATIAFNPVPPSRYR